MQVSVETTGGLERRMKVQVPAERVEREVEQRLKSLGKRAKVNGFRPGKVPFEVVKTRFGEQVRSEVVTELLQSSCNEAFAREKLNPAGGPRIDSVNTGPGKDLEFTATFEIYPEIHLKGVEGIPVEKPVAEITSDDVDAMVENLRRQRATWEPVSRAAAAGDRVVLDFDGTIEGKPFAGGKAEQVPVVLGEKRMLEDFERGVEGAQAGETREIDVRFPDDYHAKDMAGKQARFKVTVHRVEGQKLPELDQSFCESFGIQEGGIEKLRAEVSENMRREMEDTIRRKLKDQVMEALLSANPLDLPKAMLDDEIARLRQDALARIGMRDAKKAVELPRELFEEQAKRRVGLGLLVGEVINQQHLVVDPKRVDERLERMAGEYSKPAEALRSFRASQQIMHQVETLVLEEQAVDWLLDRAKVTEAPTSFKTLMKFDDHAGHDHD